MEIERHPLEPFLPANARLLMLEVFHLKRKRWSMEFYYPNWNNDMWRIVGLLFFNDKNHFLNEAAKLSTKIALSLSYKKKVLPYLIQLPPYDGCRTMHPTNFWKL